MKIEITNEMLTSKALDELAFNLLEPVIQGNVNSIEQWVKIKAIAEIADKCLKDEDFKIVVASEIEKHGKGGTTYCGVKVELSERSTLDYSTCGDPVYLEFKNTSDKLKEMIKEREKFLKSVPYAGLVITNEDTGETTTVHAPAKATTTSPKITFGK